MKKRIIIKKEEWILVNDKDISRCSIHCYHVNKVKGNYVCSLFGNASVDEGEDDDIGYGFIRVKECIDSTQPEQSGKSEGEKK